MKPIVFVVLCLTFLLAGASSKKQHHKHKASTGEEDTANKPKDELDLIAEDDALKAASANEEANSNEIPGGYTTEDPCTTKHCGPGKECKLNGDMEAECVCLEKCAPEKDDRRKVCTNHNETWNGDCEVYRMRCLCDEGSSDCTHSKYKHVHVDYYGLCRDIPKCSEGEMSDFPRRMREWLFNVMQDLAKRAELSEAALQLEKEAENSQARKWVNAVIWKFCDLDSHPHDRAVSRHELFPIRAPLLAMEHCIAPFLDGCDINDDHIISLTEWGKCLGLEENEIEDKCAYLIASQKN